MPRRDEEHRREKFERRLRPANQYTPIYLHSRQGRAGIEGRTDRHCLTWHKHVRRKGVRERGDRLIARFEAIQDYPPYPRAWQPMDLEIGAVFGPADPGVGGRGMSSAGGELLHFAIILRNYLYGKPQIKDRRGVEVKPGYTWPQDTRVAVSEYPCALMGSDKDTSDSAAESLAESHHIGARVYILASGGGGATRATEWSLAPLCGCPALVVDLSVASSVGFVSLRLPEILTCRPPGLCILEVVFVAPDTIVPEWHARRSKLAGCN